MMVVSEIDKHKSYKITFKPNKALSANNKQKVLLLITFVPVIIGLVFAYIGAWLVLPFVGIEIVALAYAFYFVNKHEADYESISIEGGALTIERCIGDNLTTEVINPYWVKVVRHELDNGELHLYLLTHGKKTEVGRYLTRKQRELLAKQLQERTGN